MAEIRDIQFKDAGARAAAGVDLARSGAGGTVDPANDLPSEKMVLNMGPSHPATHGVLRIVLELDGEIISKAMPDVGFLHRGDEKIAENMTVRTKAPEKKRPSEFDP